MITNSQEAFESIFSVQDIVGGVLAIIVIFAVVYGFSKQHVSNDLKQIFWRFFFFKIIVSLLFVTSTKYLNGLDTIMYYISSSEVIHADLNNVVDFFLDSAPQEEYRGFLKIFGEETIGHMANFSSSFLVRLASVFGFLFLGSYTAICLFFSTFAFFGAWFFFRGFLDLYPQLKRQLSIAILFFPTVSYWSSGLLKDPITFGSLGFLTYIVIQYLYFKKFKIKYILLFIMSFAFMYIIKPYIAYVFLASITVLLLFTLDFFKRNKVLRFLIILFALLLFFMKAETVFQALIDEIKEGLEFYATVESGSYVKFFEFDLSPFGFFNMVFSSFFGVYFRPFLWEANSLLMFLCALENTFVFYLTIKALPKLYFLKEIFNRNSILLFCFSFTIFMAIVVGFSTFNFGSVSRYRIPSVPMYLIFLYVIQNRGAMVNMRNINNN